MDKPILANVKYMFSVNAWIDAFKIFKDHSKDDFKIKTHANMIIVMVSRDKMDDSEVNTLNSLGWRYDQKLKNFYRYT